MYFQKLKVPKGEKINAGGLFNFTEARSDIDGIVTTLITSHAPYQMPLSEKMPVTISGKIVGANLRSQSLFPGDVDVVIKPCRRDQLLLGAEYLVRNVRFLSAEVANASNMLEEYGRSLENLYQAMSKIKSGVIGRDDIAGLKDIIQSSGRSYNLLVDIHGNLFDQDHPETLILADKHGKYIWPVETDGEVKYGLKCRQAVFDGNRIVYPEIFLSQDEFQSEHEVQISPNPSWLS